MAEKSTAKKARQPYDTIPMPQPNRIGDVCTRAADLVIPGMNKRIEDPQP